VRVTVRVPATSANLGPGFDCFGLALDLCNEVTVDTEAEPGVTWEGEGADELPTDGSDMVSRAIASAVPDHERPPLLLRGLNRIPLERGLGSSSAAAVAGLSVALVLLGDDRGRDEQHWTLARAMQLEGHPDNAAAAVFGGLTVFAPGSGYVRRLVPHPDVDPVVLVPDHLRTPTGDARRILPDTVSRGDAVFNIAHAALAIVALSEDPRLLFEALRDRLHEDARASLVPESAALLADLRRAQIPACLSGAGPSLLAFPGGGHEVGDLPAGWRTIRPGIRRTGVEVLIEG
jgi:homoserine kinase